MAFTAPSSEARYRELVKIIDRHAGFAHFTRRMNGNTVTALKWSVTENDIPVMQKTLDDKDRIIVMTCANVLMGMGSSGRKTVYNTLLNTGNQTTKRIIQDKISSLQIDREARAEIQTWTEDIPTLKTMADQNDLYSILAARDLLKRMDRRKKCDP
jgi:hypothetical protein